MLKREILFPFQSGLDKLSASWALRGWEICLSDTLSIVVRRDPGVDRDREDLGEIL